MAESSGWFQLDEEEYDQVWDRFYGEFQFRPGICESDWPSFVPPLPYVVLDLSHVFEGKEAGDYVELESAVLRVMGEFTPPGEWIYALDWQHDCYRFDPHGEIPLDEFRDWPIPLFPNGDYHFFLHPFFEWGWLGHPWEQSVTLFGEKFVRRIIEKSSRALGRILRHSGFDELPVLR